MATVVLRVPTREQVLRAAQKAARAAAMEAIQIIVKRTQAGVDADGRRFKAYSTRYRLLKASTGRSASPDLTLSGQMLNALKLLRIEQRNGRPVPIIGFGGMHTTRRFGAASKRRFVSDVATRRSTGRRTLKSGTLAAVPMATIVAANDALRPFFHLRSRADLARIREVFLEALTRALRGRG